MFAYLILAAAYAFAAVAQPGPMQAYLISRAATHGWRRMIPAAIAPLLSDGPIITVTLVVLTRLPAWFTLWLRVAGGAFVLYLAWGALQAWRKWTPLAAPAPVSAQGSILQATLVNLLNPNPWISWSLVLGPLLVKAWREAPARGIAVLVGFYSVMIAGTAATIVIFGMAKKLGPGFSRAVAGISAVALAGFGAYLLWSAA